MTSIEWTDQTWNPVTGCTKVSPGCAHCYAEGIANRLWKGRPFEDVQVHADRVGQPLRWRKPRRVFVNSMSDLFHEAVPFRFLDAVFHVMRSTPRHTYQVLTKRPERMRFYMRDTRAPLAPNVWLGVSVENQRMADERIPLLLDTPAAVRFLSVEPLLGPVNLHPWLSGGINWCIVGGESGPQARPCELPWIGAIVEQCKAAGVPVFVKQLGRRPQVQGEPACTWIADRKGGRPDEWPPELRVREWPTASVNA